MSNVDVKTTSWKLIEVGRVVLFMSGPYANRLAAIVEIIDHKRVLVDGPSKNSSVHRHSAPISNLILTPIVISKLPRGIRSGPLSKKWEEQEVEKKWQSSSWYKDRQQKHVRKNLSDFERYKAMRLKKQARTAVRQAHATIRKSAK